MPESRIPNPESSLSRYWLIIGTLALAIAGLLALALVAARTPSLATMPFFDALFHKSLAVHVDLSVLVWFLSIACLMWSLLAQGSPQIIPYLEEAALLCFTGGTLAISVSVLDPRGEALMSNYIPVITSPVFFLGLSLLLCGTGLMLVKLLTISRLSAFFDKPQQFAVYSGGLIAAIALMAFIWSHHQMPSVIDGQQYYEMSFWGGGHVLQFVHTQMLMVCWLMLAHNLLPPLRGKAGMGGGRVMHKTLLPPTLTLPRKGGGDWLFYCLFSIGLLSAFAAPVAYVFYDVSSMEHRQFFTHLMIGANGVAPGVLGLMLLPNLWRNRQRSALYTSAMMSILLFIYGGVLGGMIEGQNVVIPAHYHGSIVGITLAFMGAAYLMCPRFGWRDVSAWKMARWQPVVYGGGQALHITGLAISGGYGVLRKTPGAINEISTSVKAAMGLMGLGGLIAIIGGLMFVVVMIRAIRKS